MPIINFLWTTFVIVLLHLLGLLITPSMATPLSEVVRNSLENSIVLAAARQKWISTRESIGISTSTTDISARLTSTGLLSQSARKNVIGAKKTQSITTGVTLLKNFYDGGQAIEKGRLGQINIQRASANYLKIEQLVILSTIEAYLDVLKARREIKLLEKNLTRLEAHIAAAAIRVRAGGDTPTRLAEANARYARARSDTILIKTQLANAEDNFKSLTGFNIISFIQPKLTGALPTDVMGVESIAQSQHPDILSALAAERAADQAFNILKASVGPTFAVSLSANTKHTNSSTLDKDEVAAQIVFSFPLLSTNATRSKSRSIAASYEEAKLNRYEITRKVNVFARGAFRNWKVTTIQMSAIQNEIEAFSLVAKGIDSETQLGQKTTLDLLDAEKNINDAELSLVRAEHKHFLAAFQLKAAIGNLTAESFGLINSAGQLADLPTPENPFQDTFPFQRRKTAD